MTLDLLNDVFLLNFALKTAKRAFQRFAILQYYFCQTKSTSPLARITFRIPDAGTVTELAFGAFESPFCMQSYDISDLSSILAMARSARVVLIGEASHGTEEFYATRAEITKRLLMEFGFRGVAVEADWPDAYRVNRWVQGADNDRTAEECLDGFERFPRWMWRNTVVRDFVAWLREYNRRTPQPAGFYGLDLYSLHGSRRAVIEYLDTVDPAAARDARERYSCLRSFP